MSDLVKYEASGIEVLADRHRQLAEMNSAAEAASTPEEAHEVMLKAKVVSDLLSKIRAPFEETWLAGKASVVAARRLGRMLEALSPQAELIPGAGRANPPRWIRSPRRRVAEELGLDRNVISSLVHLGEVADAEFQRYIQTRSSIPTINGALRVARIRPEVEPSRSVDWRARRRSRANVKTPESPSLDEAYSLIVRALGHLSATGRNGRNNRGRDISGAIDHLYAAEDLLRKHTGGYTT